MRDGLREYLERRQKVPHEESNTNATKTREGSRRPQVGAGEETRQDGRGVP